MSPILYLAFALFIGLSAVDLKQSLAVQKLGGIENNPILGKHPSPKKMTAFAVGTTALWVVIAGWLAFEGVEVTWISALLAWGIFLRLWVVVKGRKVLAQLRKADVS